MTLMMAISTQKRGTKEWEMRNETYNEMHNEMVDEMYKATHKKGSKEPSKGATQLGPSGRPN